MPHPFRTHVLILMHTCTYTKAVCTCKLTHIHTIHETHTHTHTAQDQVDLSEMYTEHLTQRVADRCPYYQHAGTCMYGAMQWPSPSHVAMQYGCHAQGKTTASSRASAGTQNGRTSVSSPQAKVRNTVKPLIKGHSERGQTSQQRTNQKSRTQHTHTHTHTSRCCQKT